jgi:hypothetical protein
VKLFELKLTPCCIKRRSCSYIMQRGVKSLHCKMQRQDRSMISTEISLLPDKAGRFYSQAAFNSRKSNLAVEWYSLESIWQQEVKSTNFGRLPGLLKKQSCKKSQMGRLPSIIPMKTTQENFAMSQILWLPATCCSESQTSNSNNSSNLKLKKKNFRI